MAYLQTLVVTASVEETPEESITYQWVHDTEAQPVFKGARVTRLDRYGQSWVLSIPRTHAVTHRIAAGLLDVTAVTILNWSRRGVFGPIQRRKGTAVIALNLLEKIARERGMELPYGR